MLGASVVNEHFCIMKRLPYVIIQDLIFLQYMYLGNYIIHILKVGSYINVTELIFESFWFCIYIYLTNWKQETHYSVVEDLNPFWRLLMNQVQMRV